MTDNIADANILDLLNELGNMGSMPLENKQQIEKGIRDLVDKKRELTLIDPDFRRELADRTDRLTLVNIEDIEVVAKGVDNESPIFFVEKAGAYIIYGPGQVCNYVQDVNTILKNEKVYEVVRDNNPQKLVIVLNCNMSDPHLEQLKQSILKYIKNNSSYNAGDSDMKVFRDSEERHSKLEILVTTVIFNNALERVQFISGFREFLRSDTGSEIYNGTMVADKIEFYGKKAKGLAAQLYKTPSRKTQVARISGDDNPEKVFDLMVTPIVINNYVVNGGVNNTVNNIAGDYIAATGNATVNKTVQKQKIVIEKNKKKTIKDFYKYIYDTKPEWYIENGKVEWSTIEEFYRTYFNDQQTPRQTISQKLNGALFTAGGRSNSGATRKRLYSYADLKKNAGF